MQIPRSPEIVFYSAHTVVWGWLTQAVWGAHSGKSCFEGLERRKLSVALTEYWFISLGCSQGDFGQIANDSFFGHLHRHTPMCNTLEINPGRVSASLPHTTGISREDGRRGEGSGRAWAYYLRNVWGKVLAHPETQSTGEPYQEGQHPNLEWKNFWNPATLPCHLHARRSQPALCCLWLAPTAWLKSPE